MFNKLLWDYLDVPMLYSYIAKELCREAKLYSTMILDIQGSFQGPAAGSTPTP